MSALSVSTSKPWVEKYRPSKLDDVVGHVELVTMLSRMSEIPNILFYGPPGVGKTSVIMATARHLYGDSILENVLSINASGSRGIDTVREEILTFSRMVGSKPRLVVLDEADAMTDDAQNAMKCIIDQSAKRCRFCFICNDVSKIVEGIADRCARIRFPPLTRAECVGRLMHIARSECVMISQPEVEILCDLQPDLRQAITTLQFLHELDCEITPSIIYSHLNVPDPKDVASICSFLLDEKNTLRHRIGMLQDIFDYNRMSLVVFLDHIIICLSSPESIEEYGEDRCVEVINRAIFISKTISEGGNKYIQMVKVALIGHRASK